MGVRAWIAACVAAMACVAAGAAGARTRTFDFRVNPNAVGTSWFNMLGSGTPYGLRTNPTLAGTVSIDDTKSDWTAFTALDFTTGRKTWTLSDISNVSEVLYAAPGVIGGFELFFSPTNAVATNNAAAISDGINGIGCNNCVRFAEQGVGVIPEPATWALSILGLGMLGAAARRRRAADRVAAAPAA